MDDFSEYTRDVVSKLPYDLRAEVVIAYLKERGIDGDNIIVSSTGLFKRGFSKDVENISVKETIAGEKYTVVEINREGIYDAIPQAISHAPKRSKTGGLKTLKEMVDEVSQIRKEKEAAKKFFLPFENEFHHQSIHLEIEEQNILKGYLNSSTGTDLMNRFWQVPEILDARQKAIFIYLIPIIHKVVGKFTLTKICYQAILNVKVNFEIKNGLEQTVENSFNGDDLRLGLNFVCGHKFYDYKKYLEIIIKPLNETQLSEYLPGEKGSKIIEFLNEYYLPLGLETKVKIISDFKNKAFRLTEANSDLRLGYNCYL